MKLIITAKFLVVLFWGSFGYGDFDANEPNIYPGGLSTADTLRPKEWLLAPPPWGWLAYGANSQLTVMVDYPAFLMGFPGGLVRFELSGENKVSHWALDLYGFSLGGKGSFDQKRQKEFAVEYKGGGQAWLHLNFTAPLGRDFRFHTYLGTTYTSYHRFHSNEGPVFADKVYENAFCPDAGIMIEWNANSWLKILADASYGNSFFFVDQILYKQSYVWTLQMAPFSPKSVGILSRMRIELSAMNIIIPDAQYSATLALPLYPYISWQWGGD